MEILDVISFVEKYLVEYARIFLRTLVHPTARFRRLQTTSANNIPVKTNDVTAIGGAGSRPQEMAFVLISIFLGSVINSFVPDREFPGDIVGQIVVISFCWLFFATYTHALCRISRGKAAFEQTLWISLQVFSILFVVSSFINLVGGVFVRQPRVSSFLVSTGKLGSAIASDPFYIYFFVQFALLNVYLPLALKAIYHFGWIRLILIAIALSVPWVLFGMAFSSDIGVYYHK